MPIYEYSCTDCNKKFDALRSMKDADTPIECSYCHGFQTTRLISVFYAQGGGQVIAGGNGGGCSGCSANSCTSCGK